MYVETYWVGEWREGEVEVGDAPEMGDASEMGDAPEMGEEDVALDDDEMVVETGSEGSADADASEVTSEGEAGAVKGSTEPKDGAIVGFGSEIKTLVVAGCKVVEGTGTEREGGGEGGGEVIP
jgi:hypothetical protein